jgi:hypothetical protein
MRGMGMGDYSKVRPDQVSPTEERTFAVFIALAKDGNPDQKALIKTIRKLSPNDIFATKLWKVATDDMAPEMMSGWSKTLDAVAARAEKDGVSTEEAFYRTLEEKAQKDPALMKQYETLKAKRCFFK